MTPAKAHLKQIVKEYLLKEEDLASKVQDNEDYITKLRLAVSQLYQRYGELNADIGDMRIDFNDYMSTGERPSRLATKEEPEDPGFGTADPEELTNVGGRRILDPELDPEYMGENKMKLTRSQLTQIIKEEIGNALKEVGTDPALHSSAAQVLLYVQEELGYREPNAARLVLESALMSLEDSAESTGGMHRPGAPETSSWEEDY
tara:strand:- start:72 stop:683 length:612 start_codon:yes stop_codon:yes gene_type:complete